MTEKGERKKEEDEVQSEGGGAKQAEEANI